MKRKQIDALLFSDEVLSVEEKQALAEILESSPHFAQMDEAWKELQEKFSSLDLVSPEPGFVSRWQNYRVRREAQIKKRQAWVILGALIAVTGIGIGFLAGYLLNVLASPADLAGDILTQWVLLTQRLEFGFGLIRALSGDIHPVIPGVGLSWLASLVAWVTVAWLISMYKFAFVGIRNGVRK